MVVIVVEAVVIFGVVLVVAVVVVVGVVGVGVVSLFGGSTAEVLELDLHPLTEATANEIKMATMTIFMDVMVMIVPTDDLSLHCSIPWHLSTSSTPGLKLPQAIQNLLNKALIHDVY